MNEIRIQKGDIHDMRQEYERQLAAKDARIAALEAAILDTIKLLHAEEMFGFRDYLKTRTEELLSTHDAKSE